MTEDLITRLMSAGLSKQQATSVTAETLVQLFMNDDGKTLIREARQQVVEMRSVVEDLRKEYNALQEKINGISDSITAVQEAQEKYGDVTDEKARNAMALYAALLSMSAKAGADPEDTVRNAGYIVHAYLGGQAKREINMVPSPESSGNDQSL